MSPPYFETTSPVGQNALHKMLGGRLPEPYCKSGISARARRTFETPSGAVAFFPPSYSTDGSLRENLRFAFKYEPLDLRIVFAALQAIGPEDIADWIHQEPTGIFSRRAWFLYEYLSGERADLPDAKFGNYVDALDTKRHYVAAPENSPRHRVRNNLLGGPDLCPVLRRTPTLEAASHSRLDLCLKESTSRHSPDVLFRAVNFLYTKETRSSFAIEGETPGPKREERFLQALRRPSEFDFQSKTELTGLQNLIVDSRYAAQDWRNIQNFVGETTRNYGNLIHYICPRPNDVPALMQGWTRLTERTLASSGLDAVLAAALSAFAFVFIHPFEDGNGRIHRFLIHHILARKGFTPPGVIFPVSAAILRQRHLYDAVLETFSRSIQPAIDWQYTSGQNISVTNDTRDLYRFFDATPQAEFLYARIAETITTDFPEELNFIERFDAGLSALRDVVDMPDRRAQLLLKLLFQNQGCLSVNKRGQFPELTDDEMARMEAAVQEVLSSAVE